MQENKLTFSILEEANRQRLSTFKNSKGLPAHSKEDGSDWKLSAWMNATLGELGELSEELLMMQMIKSLGLAANQIKKVERGDKELETVKENIGKEISDVIIYLSILAMQLKIDLGQVVCNKFNEVSERVGSPIKLIADEEMVYMVKKVL